MRASGMIVYSDRKRVLDPRAHIADLVAGLAGPAPDPSALLIEAGILEAGVVDALCPEEDGQSPATEAFRAAMLDLAHAALGGRGRLASAQRRLAGLAAGELPPQVEVSEPEGFAFYALYPETYAEAARLFVLAERPENAVVVGVRSIGTTLSAMVAAELEAQGVAVRSFTVRPRGHPWDRELQLSSGLKATLAQAEHLLVVDEGPGISGTSFACVAEAALKAGVPDTCIHLFPSWDSDGSSLRSERARAVWPQVRRRVVSFEELFIDAGRLASAWGGGTTRDLSGGLWREVVYPAGRRNDWPAVQPQHERRKYLLAREDGTRLLLKFVGLGERGQRALARAELLAAAGFAPPVVGLRDGFLAHEWVEGEPAEVGGTEPSVVMDRHDGRSLGGWTAAMGEYLGLLAAQPVAAVRFGDILAMTRLNIAEGLGDVALARMSWMEGMRRAVEARPAVAVDGRMLPQEWLRTKDDRALKCDGIDHHDDHFWPGTQDIAWDLAGAMVEWGMDSGMRQRLLGRYEFCTGSSNSAGDQGAREVLPFYEAAYLAWRLGYTTLAAGSLGASEDGLRMARDRDRYAGLLRAALERGDA